MSHKKKILPVTHLFRKNFYQYALIAVCLIFLLLKLPFLNHSPAWDESVYLGMGKYIYSGGNSGLWEMIRPLGLPAITGLFWHTGMNQLIASRIFSLLISVGCIITVFLIAKELFDKRHALLSALILACTPIFFYYSEYVLTDHISTLFLMLSILFLIRERFILGGIAGGIAFWFKFTHILYVVAVLIFIAYKIFTIKKRKDMLEHSHFIIFGVIMLGFVAAYFSSNYLLYHNHFGTMDAILRPYLDASAYSNNPYQNTVFDDVKGFVYYIAHYLYNIIFHTAYGFSAYIFFIIYFLHAKKFIKDPKHVLVGIIFLVYLAYFSIIPYKNERFWIFFLPFMAMYASYGIMAVMRYFKLKKSRKPSLGKAYRALALITIIASFSISAYNIAQFYGWDRASEKPNYDIERYFDIHEVNGPILTTDPGLTAYSDKRYVGAYDILNRNGLFVNDWESKMDFAAVIYRDDAIPCLSYDIRCLENKNELLRFIDEWFVLKDSYTYRGSNVTFFVEK
jgi:4-amino-4-deoxy-L-arabinose transferase-like glycosyltransferase